MAEWKKPLRNSFYKPVFIAEDSERDPGLALGFSYQRQIRLWRKYPLF